MTRHPWDSLDQAWRAPWPLDSDLIDELHRIATDADHGPRHEARVLLAYYLTGAIRFELRRTSVRNPHDTDDKGPSR